MCVYVVSFCGFIVYCSFFSCSEYRLKYGTSHRNFNDDCSFITPSFSVHSGFIHAFVQPSFSLIDHVIAEAS